MSNHKDRQEAASSFIKMRNSKTVGFHTSSAGVCTIRKYADLFRFNGQTVALRINDLTSSKPGWRWQAKQDKVNRKKANKHQLKRTSDPRGH